MSASAPSGTSTTPPAPCESSLIVNGRSTYFCQGDAGHDGPHDSRGLHWTEWWATWLPTTAQEGT